MAQVAPRLWLAGLGWCGDRWFDTPGEGELEPLCRQLRRQALRQVPLGEPLILLSHYPARLPELFSPSGSDGGWVFHCVRRLIDELRPLAVVQGHVHEWFGTSALYETGGTRTLIVNPGSAGAMLCVDPDCQHARISHG